MMFTSLMIVVYVDTLDTSTKIKVKLSLYLTITP